MKHKILAAILSLTMLLNMTSLSAFALDTDFLLDDNMSVTPEGDNYAVPNSLDLNFGGGDIVINGGTAAVGGVPQNAANSYVIRGVQGNHLLSITNAAVPIYIETDVTTNMITATDSINIGDGKQVNALSIVDASGTRYPSVITLPQLANQTVSVAYKSAVQARSAPTVRTMTADAGGNLFLWLSNGAYELTVTYNNVKYPFTLTTDNTARTSAVQRFNSGMGTASDPFNIATQADLDKVPVGTASEGVYFKLNANNLYRTAPIGSGDGSEPFLGVFDGNGNTINLVINTNDEFAGLFAAIGSGAVVKNLALTGTVSTTGTYAGGVAGLLWKTENSTVVPVIQNVYSAVTTSARGSNGTAGGIVGRNYGARIQDVYAIGAISATLYAGGIAGIVEKGTVDNAYATSAVTVTAGNGISGGIVGASLSATVQKTIALNSSVSGGNAGRIAGYKDSSTFGLNSAWQYMPVRGGYPTTEISVSGINGEHVDYARISSTTLYDRFDRKSNWNIASGQLATLKKADSTPFPSTTAQPSAISPYLAYTPPTSGGGGGGGGNNEPPYSETFWKQMLDQIDDADSGDTIKFSTSKLDNMPISILKALKGKNVTLEISYGGEKIKINGKRMYAIPNNRVFYNWDDLADLYEKQPASSSKPASSKPASSKPAASSKPVASSKPAQPTTPAPVVPTPTPPVASSAPESSSAPSSSSEPESSEPEEEILPEEEPEEDIEADVEPEKPKRSMVPLVVAGIVIVLALAGAGGVFYFYYYRRRPEDFYDLDDK